MKKSIIFLLVLLVISTACKRNNPFIPDPQPEDYGIELTLTVSKDTVYYYGDSVTISVDAQNASITDNNLDFQETSPNWTYTLKTNKKLPVGNFDIIISAYNDFNKVTKVKTIFLKKIVTFKDTLLGPWNLVKSEAFLPEEYGGLTEYELLPNQLSSLTYFNLWEDEYTLHIDGTDFTHSLSINETNDSIFVSSYAMGEGDYHIDSLSYDRLVLSNTEPFYSVGDSTHIISMVKARRTYKRAVNP